MWSSPCLSEVVSSWILWFTPVPPTPEIAPSDAFAVICSWLETLLLPSLLSHVHGLISSLSASPKHIWYNPCWPTFVTFLASFSHASYPGSWQKFLHFKIITGQGRGKGAKCLKIPFGTRILYHTWHLHCFSHPGEWKGLCSKPQSELTSEAAWNSLQRKSIVL